MCHNVNVTFCICEPRISSRQAFLIIGGKRMTTEKMENKMEEFENLYNDESFLNKKLVEIPDYPFMHLSMIQIRICRLVERNVRPDELTVGDLESCLESEVQALKGIGKYRWEKLISWMEKYGLKFAKTKKPKTEGELEYGYTRLYLPESIERTLDRIEQTYISDVQKGKSYYSLIKRNGKEYVGTDTVLLHLADFRRFKARLKNEDAIDPLLICKKYSENEAKIKLMYEIWTWYDPLWNEDIKKITNDVFVQKELRNNLNTLSRKRGPAKAESKKIIKFIDTAHYSSWGMDDERYRIRDFRLVRTPDEFEDILKNEKAEEISASSNCIEEFNIIRVALVTLDFETLYKKKGLYEEYIHLRDEYVTSSCFENAVKMFNLWHDVRETAIYYVYCPVEVK